MVPNRAKHHKLTLFSMETLIMFSLLKKTGDMENHVRSIYGFLSLNRHFFTCKKRDAEHNISLHL